MRHGGPDDDPDDREATPRWSWPAATLAILIASLVGWVAIVALVRLLWS